MKELETYIENGFYIKRNLLCKNICQDIISRLNKIKTDMMIPHTNIQFGYGNIINTELASIITDNAFIKKFCNQLYGQNYYYNSLYVHNKHKWVGPDVEWHQEVFNIKTFHPTNTNYTIDEIKNNFMQVYVALEDQHIENGGLKIIPYQDTILEHYDTTNTHLNHKRAITPNELDKIYKQYGIINLDLKAGDVLFFNHLIPHSSSSNNSPFDRKAMVFLTYKNNEDFDENIRIEEKNYRKKFALKYIEDMLDIKKNKQMYECGNETKFINKTWSSIFEQIPWFNDNLDTLNDYSLTTLLKLNGHLTSHSKYDVNNWKKTINHFKETIDYNPEKKYKILEVGCGAGALLKMFEDQCIYGIDPSNKYINIIKKALPLGEFKIGHALDIDCYNNNHFDVIFCHSCIQYFKDYNYFNEFINLCYKKLKPNGNLCLTDLQNLDMKKKYIIHRKKVIGEKIYKEKYENTNLEHFYISKQQIISSLSNNFNTIKFTDAVKRGIEDDFYRMNLFCKKNNDGITTREYNLLTNESTMEPLYTLHNFPVSLSCVPSDLSHNKVLDMDFEICNKTGIIQIRDAPSLSDIYIYSHNTSIGNTWNELFTIFANKVNAIINKNNFTNVIEIGSGVVLRLAQKILKNKNIINYTIYEKNLSFEYVNDERIQIYNSYFTHNTPINICDLIIHSHVLEHVWNPKEFIECIGTNIQNNTYHCFIVPNLKQTFSNKYTNALDFEHNFYIIEEYIDVILNNNNFEILEKEYFIDHSIIYITKKIDNKNIDIKTFPNLYESNKLTAMNFYNYHTDLILKLNKKIENFTGDLYLFGGTGFSIYLIKFGLKTNKIKNILDNDPNKENKKVYGTNFIVKNPSIINNCEHVAVIVKAASYQNEIEEQLYKLNKKVIILT